MVSGYEPPAKGEQRVMEGESFYVYLLPNATRFCKEFYQEQLRIQPHIQFGDEPRETRIIEEGVMFKNGLSAPGSRYAKPQQRADFFSEHDFFRYYAEREKQLRTDAESAIAKAELSVRNRKINSAKLNDAFRTTTEYTTLCLDKVLDCLTPKQKIVNALKEAQKYKIADMLYFFEIGGSAEDKETVAASVLNRLLAPQCIGTFFDRIYDGLLELSLKSDAWDMDYFAEKQGYLAATDIFPKLETREQIRTRLNTPTFQRSLGELDFERVFRQQQIALARMRLLLLNQKLLETIPKGQISEIRSLLQAITLSMDFNEYDREIRARCFRLFRRAFEQKGIPLATGSLTDLL